MKYYSVVKLDIALKFAISMCRRDIERIVRALPEPKAGMHASRSISFAIITTETPDKLHARLRPILREIHSVDNFWCSTAPRDLIGMDSPTDPMCDRIAEAWREARYRNYPDYVEKPESLQSMV